MCSKIMLKNDNKYVNLYKPVSDNVFLFFLGLRSEDNM